MKDTKIIIGEWLKEKREERSLSLQQAANKIGVAKTTIYYWEKGKRSIYADDLINYAKALGADINELVDIAKNAKR